jgi:hypothetical protein
MLQRVDPARVKQTVGVLKSFAVGVAAFFLGVAATKLNRVLQGPLWFLDDVVLSIFAGLIVLWYERLRIRDLRQRLSLANQMNHQVRNELQTLGYAALVQQDEHLSTIIRNAVNRIDLILREVLTETGRLPHHLRRVA